MKNTYPFTKYLTILMLVAAPIITFAAQESEVIEGELLHEIEDDFENAISRDRFFIKESDSEEIRELNFGQGKIPERLKSAATGTKVKIKGKKKGKKEIEPDLVDEESGDTLAMDIVTFPSTALKGNKHVLAVRVDFTDQIAVCDNESTIYNNMFNANNAVSTKNFFRTNSQGIFDITGETATVKLNFNAAAATSCDYILWQQEADKKLVAAGYNLSKYQNRMYYLPANIPPCSSWAGKGYVGGGPAYQLTWIKYCRMKTLAHELGHNYGLIHASSGEKGSSTWSEYGDASCTMGVSNINPEFNAAHKNKLGWMPLEKVQTISANGTYRVSPLNADSSSIPYPQVFKIARPSTSDFYYISYRDQSGSFDAALASTYANRLNISTFKDAGTSLEYSYFITALGDAGTTALKGTNYTITNISRTNDYIEFSISGGSTSTNDTTPPSVSITSPSSGSSYGVGTTISATASASDNVGVTKVEFYLNGSLKCSDTSSPYNCSFSMVSGSNLPLMAKAYDAAGNSKESAIVSISSSTADTIKPTVSMTSPTNGSKFPSGSTVTATASASDNVGVTKVSFYVAGSLKCTDTTSPYSCNFSMPTGSSISVRALAYDAAGNYTYSSYIYLSNPVIDTTAPTVSLTSPASGSSFGEGESVTAAASASDNIGVTKVEFYLNGSLLCSDTTSPYSCNFSMPNGSDLPLKAKAYDAAGNSSESGLVLISSSVTTVDTTKPVASMTSPSNGSSFSQGSTVTATASASDNVGVTKVIFYVGGMSKCIDYTAPFSCSFTMGTGKSYSVRVKAFDAAGNYAYSSYIYIKNSDADIVAPSVTLDSPISGSSFAEGSTVTATATASDNIGVTKVYFYVGGTLKCADSTAPFTCDFTMPAGTNISVRAKAYDAANNYSYSSYSYISTPSSDTTAPSVSITSPSSGSKIAEGTTVTMTASASDNSYVNYVRFEVNGITKCTDYTAPYSCNFIMPTGTNVLLKAHAFDSAGNNKSASLYISN
jgi:hypothetical protein